MRLVRENQQLRRELEDAHYRIRELETSFQACQSSLPSSGGGDDDDDYDDDDLSTSSIEVQSVDNGVSVTSSVTTIPTGSSALANKYRARQQKRDVRQEKANALQTKRRRHKLQATNTNNNPQANAHYLLNKSRDPYRKFLRKSSQMSLLLPHLREDDVRDDDDEDDCSLPFLILNSSVSSGNSDTTSRRPNNARGERNTIRSERSGPVSSDDVSRAPRGDTTCTKHPPANPVAASAMGYLARIASTDSEFSFQAKEDGGTYIEI